MTQPGSPSTGSRPPTILVVDDEDTVRALVSRALREVGYRVLQAQHGAAALAVLDAQLDGIDLVITDLVMPGVGGRDVARWVATHRAGLPMLFISGYPRAYLEAHDLYDSEMPLLRKPFLPSRLLETVQELLPTTAQPEQRSAAEGG